VPPSFIFTIFASGSCGFVQSWFEPLFALLVQASQVLARRRLDPRRLCEPFQVLVVLRAVVAPHDAAQRSIGFQRRRVDTNRATAQQSLFGQYLQHEGEHLFVHFDVQPLANPAQTGMIRRRFVHCVAEKRAQRERVGAAPRDPALGVESFEADERHAHVHARRNARTALAGGVVLRAAFLDVAVELRGREDRVQPIVERVTWRSRKIARRDPQVRLLGHRSSLHRHQPPSSSRKLSKEIGV
jgi:hypothetical protein